MQGPSSRGLDGSQKTGSSSVFAPHAQSYRLLLLPVRSELADIGPEVGDLLRVLDARKDHLGAWDHRARIVDVFLERVLAPDDAGRLVGLGIAETRSRARVAAVEAVELGTDLVLRARADRMAGQAHLEDLLARSGVLRVRGASHRQRGQSRGGGEPNSSFHLVRSSYAWRWRPDRSQRPFPCVVPALGGGRQMAYRRLECELPGGRIMSVHMPEPDQAVLGRRARIVATLRQLVPGEGVIATEREMRPFESDGLTAYRQLPMVVVLPETTRQVSEVLKYCHEEGIKVVPRGAGTSLSGGALPLADGVLLGMAKFNSIR